MNLQTPDLATRTGTTPVPFVDLKAQYALVKDDVEQAVLATLNRGDYVGGAAVSEFEANFARYCQTTHAIGVGNGTDALRLALEAVGAAPSKEVVTVAHTFFATAEAIVNTGASPRFVDVDNVTGNIDPALIESAINEHTVAIVAVHLYGRPADMDTIKAVAHAHGLPVIEDAAQAQGAIYKDRRVGSLGDVACFSFYPSKNLGAAGDAGAITTNNDEIADRVRLIANHGSRFKHIHDVIGHNSRLDTIQAVVLNAKLPFLDGWNDARRSLAREYHRALGEIPAVRLPAPDSNSFRSVHHLFAVRVPQRDAIGLELRHRGIATAVHYPIGVHRQAAFGGLSASGLPNTEDWADNELSLPMFETMTGSQVATVCEVLSQVVR